MPFSSSRNIPLLVLSFTFASLVSAQSSDEGDFNGSDRPREGGKLSLSVASKADYSGGAAPSASVMPALEYHWANGWFAGTNRGVGYNFSKDPTLQYGLGLGLDLGRKESATGALAGMGKALSLAGFNAGIELGQIAVALTAALVMRGVRQVSGHAGLAKTTRLASYVSMALGSFWFFQRALG